MRYGLRYGLRYTKGRLARELASTPKRRGVVCDTPSLGRRKRGTRVDTCTVNHERALMRYGLRYGQRYGLRYTKCRLAREVPTCLDPQEKGCRLRHPFSWSSQAK